MNHDPLCGFHRESSEFDFVADACARCEFIAKVRIDEREKAAQRVEALCAHTKYEGCPPCSHSESAAAVRGEL